MIKVNGNIVNKEYYPDGTLNLNCEVNSYDINIEWKFENNEEMVFIYFLTKHLREQYEAENIKLYLPYVPNSRMDRIKNPQEVFTLKYFCEFINSLKFNTVIVRDVHSNVALALLNNIIIDNVKYRIDKLLNNLSDVDIVFYPDEGASKRYSELINHPYAFGIKNREWSTGKILGLDVHGDIPHKLFNVLIIDDICSYGGTFYHSAKKLKEMGANRIYLYVTHCENSVLKGDLINSGLIDRIYTTESIFTEEHPLIEVI